MAFGDILKLSLEQIDLLLEINQRKFNLLLRKPMPLNIRYKNKRISELWNKYDLINKILQANGY